MLSKRDTKGKGEGTGDMQARKFLFYGPTEKKGGREVSVSRLDASGYWIASSLSGVLNSVLLQGT